MGAVAGRVASDLLGESGRGEALEQLALRPRLKGNHAASSQRRDQVRETESAREVLGESQESLRFLPIHALDERSREAPRHRRAGWN
ncbi:hypothetical protein PSCLAVI8L_130342 [Pseudoclavibacter sp. 8L]|nr:hypothetical protein PSCLAVI8L_130342 [Pseudoclavibacter sp. 8L]